MTAESTAAAPLLEIRDVTKTFAAQESPLVANSHINLTIERGKSLALVGESGSGKTTLARIVCGLDEPDSGTVHILGTPLTSARAKEKRTLYRHLQMVFQNPVDSFNPRRKLGQSILDAAANAGVAAAEARARLPHLLEEVGLPTSYAERYPSQVSGGECQRAAIARALAFGPELLVCDECTSALDVLVQSQIIELLNRLRTTTQVTLLFISHDLAVVSSVADEVAVMLKGHIVEYGPVNEVLRAAKHPYTQLMSASVFPTEPKSGWQIPVIEEREVKTDASAPFTGCPFSSRCPKASERCAHELPADHEVASGHLVKCWLYDEDKHEKPISAQEPARNAPQV
ncbi:MAG: ABC transporter ATP-binding protein [Coriobacteriales bacterium]|jgi:oligopeptide/dipeptide ABC transporter ATP-binding protein